MAAQGARHRRLGITREVQDEFAYQSTSARTTRTAGHFAERSSPDQNRDQGQRQARRRRAAGARTRSHPRCRRRRRERLGLGSRPAAEHEAQMARYTRLRHGRRAVHARRKDEPVRPETSLEALAKLKPLDRDGTVTAGNAPGVNDGAGALVLSSADVRASAGTERSGRSSTTPASLGPGVSRAHAGDGIADPARQARS